MTKIAFIGAGSFGFTRKLVNDVLTFSRLQDATIALMDVDDERLAYIHKAVNRIVKEGNYPAKIVVTKDRREALAGADAVLCTILNGGLDIWRKDIEIPKQFGVDINVGDTRGPSGIFRFLRTAPVMLSICKDMEELCPNAILLNYTNPMAMLCRAMQSQSKIQVSGLCHSVQGTASMLAKWIGAPMSEIDYVCAGINHQAFYLEYKWKGQDAYPLIREAMKRPEVYNEEQVRNEMFLAMDYYVTESSGHNSEYNWWFRKRPELIEKYCTNGTGWNPGAHAFIVKSYEDRQKNWKDEIEKWLNNPEPLKLQRGAEYAAYIINAYLGGDTYVFNGNIPNTGLITNLPENACVEVPVLVTRNRLNPIHVGALPPQLAALNNLSVAIEEMAVTGSLNGDARMIYQAICYDPLTAACLSLAEIKDMVKAMLAFNQPWLPQFKSIDF